MLAEIEKTRQIPGEGTRRWFRDEDLDLIIWYGKDTSIEGFQLCYDKLSRERALTYRKPNSYQHHAVDAGEPVNLGPKMSPVLVADGVVNIGRLERIFAERSANVPRELVAFVTGAIRAYPGN